MGQIKVTIDKRTELMNIMLYLSDYYQHIKDPFNYDMQYSKDIIEHFSKYKDHKAIKIINYMLKNFKGEKAFTYDAPIDLILQVKDDWSYDKLREYPFYTRFYEDKHVLEFLDSIKDFVADTDYEKFYSDHKGVFDKIISQFKECVNDKLIDDLETLYKTKFDRTYTLNIMPTQVRNNFGCSRDNESISNISVRIDSNNNLKKWNYDISELFFHEFSHPIINPLSDKYLGNISSPLSEKTLKALEERAYCNGPCYFNESVIRAMTIIYHDYVSNSSADEEEYIQDEEEIGFVHTRLLLKKLKEFEKQDKSIEEFYPQLKDVFLIDVENMSASDEHQ